MDHPPVAVGSSTTRDFSGDSPPPDATGSYTASRPNQKNLPLVLPARRAAPLLLYNDWRNRFATNPTRRRRMRTLRGPTRHFVRNFAASRFPAPGAAFRRTPATSPQNGTGEHEPRLRPMQDPRGDHAGSKCGTARAAFGLAALEGSGPERNPRECSLASLHQVLTRAEAEVALPDHAPVDPHRPLADEPTRLRGGSR